MDSASLEELYFATVLELADHRGHYWRITPTLLEGDDASRVLSPHSEAFILTAENPESAGQFSPEENAAATASLAHELDHASVVVRACPGYSLESDHVEPGFALLANPDDAPALRDYTMSLARSYRQNAIFHLTSRGLGLIGVLRPELQGFREVQITPSSSPVTAA
jgi:hypothetical protein